MNTVVPRNSTPRISKIDRIDLAGLATAEERNIVKDLEKQNFQLEGDNHALRFQLEQLKERSIR